MESKYTKVYDMAFGKVFPLLIAKAERKQRTRSEVLQVTSWLTGYSEAQITSALESNISYGDFFRHAPALNPLREKNKRFGLWSQIRFHNRTFDARHSSTRQIGRRLG